MMRIQGQKRNKQSSHIALLLFRVFFGTFLFASSISTLADYNSVKIAFTADQGTGDSARSVLQLIADEAADLLLIQGDLGYNVNSAATWEANLNSILGANFPILTVVGNHENHEWPVYKGFIESRLNRIADLNCVGNIGVKAVCSFRGIDVVQVAPGISEVPAVLPDDYYSEYLDNKLNNSVATWKICSWHKNQHLMQVGGKSNQTGWGVYQSCLAQGAIVATGHEHSYSRTHLMSNFQDPTIIHTNSHMQIDKGASIAFVSGLGGHSIRPQLLDNPWWASVQSATQAATHGVLFCDFASRYANCYYKDINGTVQDSFSLESQLSIQSPPLLLGVLAAITNLLLD